MRGTGNNAVCTRGHVLVGLQERGEQRRNHRGGGVCTKSPVGLSGSSSAGGSAKRHSRSASMRSANAFLRRWCASLAAFTIVISLLHLHTTTRLLLGLTCDVAHSAWPWACLAIVTCTMHEVNACAIHACLQPLVTGALGLGCGVPCSWHYREPDAGPTRWYITLRVRLSRYDGALLR